MRDERGIVLVIAVLAMVTVTFLGIAAMMTSDIEVRMSGNQRSMDAAFYVADGGIDNGLHWMTKSGAAKPAEDDLPTMKETKDAPDPGNDKIFSRHYINDLHYSRNPPKGWDVAKFRRYYYQIYSKGDGPDGAKVDVEVIASMVCTSVEY
jgi:hypothetical protein